MQPSTKEKERTLSDIVIATDDRDIRIHQGILLEMIRIAEEDGSKVDDDQLKIMQKIFDEQLRIKTGYARSPKSYVAGTLHYYDTLKARNETGTAFTNLVEKSFGLDDAHLFTPAYSDFTRVISEISAALRSRLKPETGERRRINVDQNFVRPLKTFFGIIRTDQEEVMKYHIIENLTNGNGKKALTGALAQNMVKHSEQDRPAFVRKSRPAKNLVKAFIHDSYQDDGEMDNTERAIIQGIGRVIGGFSAKDIDELEKETKLEDKLQRVFVEGFILRMASLKRGCITAKDLDDFVFTMEGLTGKEISDLYAGLREGKLGEEQLEEFLVEKDADLEILYSQECESEEDMILSPKELSARVATGLLSPERFDKQIRRYCSRKDLQSRVLRNIRDFQEVLDLAYADGQITGKEFSMLRYAAKYVYGIRDDMVFEKMLSRYGKQNRIVVCLAHDNKKIEAKARASGYIVTTALLRNILRFKREGGLANEWIEILNTTDPAVILLDDSLYPPKQQDPDDTREILETMPFTEKNRHGETPVTNYADLRALAHQTTVMFAEQYGTPVLPLRILEDRQRYLSLLKELASSEKK